MMERVSGWNGSISSSLAKGCNALPSIRLAVRLVWGDMEAIERLARSRTDIVDSQDNGEPMKKLRISERFFYLGRV
jgi:hypothetical protein